MKLGYFSYKEIDLYAVETEAEIEKIFETLCSVGALLNEEGAAMYEGRLVRLKTKLDQEIDALEKWEKFHPLAIVRSMPFPVMLRKAELKYLSAKLNYLVKGGFVRQPAIFETGLRLCTSLQVIPIDLTQAVRTMNDLNDQATQAAGEALERLTNETLADIEVQEMPSLDVISARLSAVLQEMRDKVEKEKSNPES